MEQMDDLLQEAQDSIQDSDQDLISDLTQDTSISPDSSPEQSFIQGDVLSDESDDEFAVIRAHYETEQQLSTDEMDRIADFAVKTLREILQLFGETSCSIDEFDGENGELILDVNGGDLAVLIGRHGRTLEALQMVLTSLLSSRMKFYYPVIVDIESYKSRRKKKVISVAQNAARKVRLSGREITLNPMSAYDRRLVHLTLRDADDIDTYSVGEEPYRKVVIAPR